VVAPPNLPFALTSTTCVTGRYGPATGQTALCGGDGGCSDAGSLSCLPQ
jgi:hypothetical protein